MGARFGFVIRIHPDDNVLVLTQSTPAGAELEVEGQAVRLPKALGLGHKLAARDIAKGEKILKYGMPIGTATAAIRRGEHVHIHNVASDYLPTFTHDEGHRYGRGAK